METKSTNEESLPPINVDELAGTNTGEPTVPVSSTWPPTSRYQEGWDPSFEQKALDRQRPIGVIVIAIANFLGALLIGLIWILAITTGEDIGYSILILPLTVAFAIAVGIGLLQLKNWARVVAFVGYGINILFDVFGFLTGPVASGTIINLAIAAVIIWYLAQPKVAEVFD